MSLARRIVGTVFALAVGAGLYYGWPEFWALVRNPWIGDMRFPIMFIYTVAGLWIAEKIWAAVDARWRDGEE